MKLRKFSIAKIQYNGHITKNSSKPEEDFVTRPHCLPHIQKKLTGNVTNGITLQLLTSLGELEMGVVKRSRFRGAKNTKDDTSISIRRY